MREFLRWLLAIVIVASIIGTCYLTATSNHYDAPFYLSAMAGLFCIIWGIKSLIEKNLF